MLNPTFLLASTINADGCIELPVVERALPFPVLNALFWPDEDGEVLQRLTSVFAPAAPSNEAGPLDMTLLGRCLTATLGGLTPGPFRVEREWSGGVRLVHGGEVAERVRTRMLRDAFGLHVAACEERLP